jgi:hypothetical protein
MLEPFGSTVIATPYHAAKSGFGPMPAAPRGISLRDRNVESIGD